MDARGPWFHRRSVDNDTATRIVLRLIELGFRVGGLGLRACGSGAWASASTA